MATLSKQKMRLAEGVIFSLAWLQMSLAFADATAYQWRQIHAEAPWRKTYNFQMMTIGDRLWVFHPDGAYSSDDGDHWQRSRLTDAVGNQAFLDYVIHNNEVLALGHFEGNIEKHTFEPRIQRTVDLTRWEPLGNSNLPKRFFYHPFVFSDSIWLIGGEDQSQQYDDIWSSRDGLHWERRATRLAFGPRSNSQIVRLDDWLYLLDHDVWRSKDALHWQQVSAGIVPGQRIFGYKAIVFDGRIWLLGCNRDGRFTSQVLTSVDGASWQSQEAPWLPRGGIAAAVFQGRLYMTGGKYGGTPEHTEFRYDNDLWVMTK